MAIAGTQTASANQVEATTVRALRIEDRSDELARKAKPMTEISTAEQFRDACEIISEAKKRVKGIEAECAEIIDPLNKAHKAATGLRARAIKPYAELIDRLSGMVLGYERRERERAEAEAREKADAERRRIAEEARLREEEAKAALAEAEALEAEGTPEAAILAETKLSEAASIATEAQEIQESAAMVVAQPVRSPAADVGKTLGFVAKDTWVMDDEDAFYEGLAKNRALRKLAPPSAPELNKAAKLKGAFIVPGVKFSEDRGLRGR